MEITIPLKTKHPYGFRTARGRNGDFIAVKALVCSTREKDAQSGEPIINLKIYSKQRGGAAPIFLCLQITEWLEIMSAIERIFWQVDTRSPDKGG
jgi:hypothetical protein